MRHTATSLVRLVVADVHCVPFWRILVGPYQGCPAGTEAEIGAGSMVLDWNSVEVRALYRVE